MTTSTRATWAVLGGLMASLGQAGLVPCSWAGIPLLFVALIGADWRTAFVIGALHGASDALDGAGVSGFGGIAIVLLFGGSALNRAFVAVACTTALRRTSSALRAVVFAVVFLAVDTVGAFLQGPFHTPLSLGSTQCAIPALAQMGTVVGERGLTFLVVLVGALLGDAWVARRLRSVVVAFAVVVAWVGIGAALRSGVPSPERMIPAATIQGAVPGHLHELARYDVEAARAIEGVFVTATREAARAGARLVIWPEGSVRSGGVEHVAFRGRMQDLARELGITLIIGADVPQTSGRRWNGVLVIDARGDVEAVGKVGLLPVLEPEYEAAPGWRVVDVDGAKVGILVCAESLTSTASSAFADSGVQGLIVIANDAGLGRSRMEYIHATRARLRAVELRVAAIHAGQWARTLVVDAAGEIIAEHAEPGFAVTRFSFPLAPGR
jgi:apolipoprotein N-acyltransferase